MKKLILLAALLPLTAFCQSGTFTIKGKLSNISRPVTVYLLNVETQRADSVITADGTYSFTGKVSAPATASLILDKDKKGYKNSFDRAMIYLEPGTINVNSDRDLMRFSVIGGTTNNDAEQTRRGLAKAAGHLDKLMSEKKKAATPEQRQSEAFTAEIAALEKEKLGILIEETIRFIKAHPNSIPSIITLVEVSDFIDYPQVDALYQSLAPVVKDSPAGKPLVPKLAVLKRVSLNAVAPDLSSTDTLGNTVKLSSLRGKYVLVDVWASWCAPCRKENPNQVKTYNKFKNENFTVIGVSLDDERKSWVNAIRKDGLPWINVSDLKGWQSNIVELYGLNAVPQNYLLDPSGVIIAKNLQGIDLSNKLGEIFGRR